MTNTPYSNYRESEVLSADSMELVNLLYRAAIDAIAAARRHLREGRIRERSTQITKALGILQELTFSLDHERGGELSRSLAELYVYMHGRLTEANAQQVDPPLAEVQELLSTLLEAWSALRKPAPAAA
jgi:flagellar protein FliS